MKFIRKESHFIFDRRLLQCTQVFIYCSPVTSCLTKRPTLLKVLV